MKRIFAFTLLLLLTVSNLFAQSDSLTLAKTNWETVKLAKGIVLKQHHFKGNLFSSNQYIAIVEIKSGKKIKFNIAYEKQLLKPTADFGKADKAIVALNGSFFDVTNGGSVDYLRANNVLISANRLGKDSTRAMHQKAAISVKNGKIAIKNWDGSKKWEQALEGEDVLLTGPMLVLNNQRYTLDTTAFVRLRHPRTAIARVKDRIYLVTVDGRNDQAAGMSLYELANIFAWMGASEAINLDGGGSTTLWVDSKAVKGIINHPSDNKKWDHEGERKVANAVTVILDPH